MCGRQDAGFARLAICGACPRVRAAGQIKTERVPSMIATPERHTMLKGQSTLSAVAVTRNQRHLQLYWLEAPGSSLREEIGVAQQAIEDVAHTLAAIYNSRNSNAVVPRSTSSC